MFLHRNYLCFIWHEIFDPLRKSVNGISHKYENEYKRDADIQLELISLFLSSLVPQLSGKGPMLYPLVKPTWLENDPSQKHARRLSEITILDDGQLEARAERHRRRRTKWEFTETNDEQLLSTLESQPRRRLSSVTNNNDSPPQPPSTIMGTSLQSQLKQTEIASIMNFFGSHSKGSTCWCDERLDKDTFILLRPLSCKERCADISTDLMPRLSSKNICN